MDLSSGASIWKGWKSPGVLGEMFAWLLLVVHAQGAGAATSIGLKILTSPRRPIDEKATSLIQRLLQPGGGFPSASSFSCRQLTCWPRLLQPALLALNDLADGLKHKYGRLRMRCGFK